MSINKNEENKLKSLAKEVYDLWCISGKIELNIKSGNELTTINLLGDNQKIPLLKAFNLSNEVIISYEKEGLSIGTIKKRITYFRKTLNILCGNNIDDKILSRNLPYCLMTLDNNKQKDYNEIYQEKIQDNQTNLIPLSKELINNYLKLGVSFIRRNKPLNNKETAYKILGLSMLTGRRMYIEVCLQGSFTPYISSDYIFFLGQAKGGIEKKEKPYKIPLLKIDCKELMIVHNDIINYIQEKPYYQKLIEEISDNVIKEESVIIRNNFKNYIQTIINCEILPLFLPLYKQGYQVNFTAKDTRKIYATIIHNDYVEKTNIKIDFLAYIPQFLGHTSDFTSGKIKDNTETTKSYRKYYIT